VWHTVAVARDELGHHLHVLEKRLAHLVSARARARVRVRVRVRRVRVRVRVSVSRTMLCPCSPTAGVSSMTTMPCWSHSCMNSSEYG